MSSSAIHRRVLTIGLTIGLTGCAGCSSVSNRQDVADVGADSAVTEAVTEAGACGLPRVAPPDLARGPYAIGGGFRLERRPRDASRDEPVMACTYPCERIIPGGDAVNAENFGHIGPYFFASRMRLDTRTGEIVEVRPPDELTRGPGGFYFGLAYSGREVFAKYSFYEPGDAPEHHAIVRVDCETFDANVFWAREWTEIVPNQKHFGISQLLPLGRWLVFAQHEGSVDTLPNAINLETGQTLGFNVQNEDEMNRVSDHEIAWGFSSVIIDDLDAQLAGRSQYRRTIVDRTAPESVRYATDRYAFYFAPNAPYPAMLRNHITGEEFVVEGPNPHFSSDLTVSGEWATWKAVTTAGIPPSLRPYLMDRWLMHIPSRTKWKLLEAKMDTTAHFHGSHMYLVIFSASLTDANNRVNGTYRFTLPTLTQIAARAAIQAPTSP